MYNQISSQIISQTDSSINLYNSISSISHIQASILFRCSIREYVDTDQFGHEKYTACRYVAHIFNLSRFLSLLSSLFVILSKLSKNKSIVPVGISWTRIHFHNIDSTCFIESSYFPDHNKYA